MGGAFTAVADDATALYWNTAGLSQLTHLQVSLMHISYLDGINYEFIAGAIPFQPGSTLGLSASYDYVPAFNSTNDPSAVPGSASDLVVDLGFGQSFNSNVAVGIGAKIINSQLLNYGATGEGVDGGLLFSSDHREFNLGLSVQNIGYFSNYSQYVAQENLPMAFRGGCSYRFQPTLPTHLTLALDILKEIDNDPIIEGGCEFWWGIQDVAFALRAGYSFNNLYQDLGGVSGTSLGAGVKFQDWELDYALVPFGDLGNTQRFSITFELEPVPAHLSTSPSMSVQVQAPQADFKTGAVKQATFDLKPTARTEIKNWTLEITDPKGNILRTYSGKGVPPRQIAWDGKDSTGNVVAGGVFANYNLRTVDTRGQQVLATEPLFHFSPEEVAERKLLERGSGPAVSHKLPSPHLPPDLHPLGLSGVIKVPNVPFEEGSATLSREYDSYLEQVARLIRRYPDSRVYLEGHADSEGTEVQNLRLSQYRADAVMRYLVEEKKVEPSNLYARGRGTANALDFSNTELAHLRNRRVEIVILTK